jgi:hypothetical protein
LAGGDVHVVPLPLVERIENSFSPIRRPPPCRDVPGGERRQRVVSKSRSLGGSRESAVLVDEENDLGVESARSFFRTAWKSWYSLSRRMKGPCAIAERYHRGW